jgi:hypothetical protein
MTNILFLDNDECLGYFGLLSALYNLMITRYLVSKNIKLVSAIARQFNNIFIDVVTKKGGALDIGFARPDLKAFFMEVYKLKSAGLIDHIVMFTSAPRYVTDIEKDYCDWVKLMREMLNKYVNLEIYTDDYSGTTDGKETSSIIGGTVKDVGVYLKMRGIKKVDRVMFLDDRPENILCSDCKVIGIKKYYYFTKLEILKSIAKELETRLKKLDSSYFYSEKMVELMWYEDEMLRIGLENSSLLDSFRHFS